MGEKKKARVFSREFKLGAVGRMQAGESPSALARELGVRRNSLYAWKQRVEEAGPRSFEASGGRPSTGEDRVSDQSDQRRIAELERLVGKQQALIHFFENALQQVDAATTGKAESTKRSGKSANAKEPS
jgi:transposase-like protein